MLNLIWLWLLLIEICGERWIFPTGPTQQLDRSRRKPRVHNRDVLAVVWD